MKRDTHPCRIAATGRTKEEVNSNLKERLRFIQSHSATTRASHSRSGKLLFVFCGMGTSWQGMGREFLQERAFRDKISEIDAELKTHVPWSLEERLRENFDVTDLLYGPIATFAYQVAQFALWRSWGVQPHAVVGQSVGEVAAACCAGILSTKEATKLIYLRTKAIASARSGGAMVAVTDCKVQDVRSACEEKPGQVTVGLHYSPTACAVSGDKEVVEEIKATLQERFPQCKCQDLRVKFAYHSHHMASCRKELLRELTSLNFSKPTNGVEIASTVRGGMGSQDDFTTPDYWARSIQDPNLFYPGLEALLDPSKLNVIVEIGPRPILGAHMKEFAKLDIDLFRYSSSEKENETQCMKKTLIELFEHGWDPCWRQVMDFPTKRLTDLPMYHFDRKKHFVRPGKARREFHGFQPKPGDHRLLRKINGGPNTTFKMVLEGGSLETVFQHKVHGTLILPGALHVELGLAAAWLMDVTSLHCTTVSLTFLEPVRLDPKSSLELDVVTTPREDRDRFNVQIKQGEVTIAVGEITVDKAQGRDRKFDLAAARKRCVTKMSAREIKGILKEKGFDYGSDWWMLGDAAFSDGEVVAALQPESRVKEEAHGLLFHPAILDAMFQAMLPLSPSGPEQNVIPVEVEGCRLFRPAHEGRYAYGRKTVDSGHQWSFHLLLLTEEGKVVLEVTSFKIREIGSPGSSKFLTRLVWKKMDNCTPPEPPYPDSKHVLKIGDFMQTRARDKIFSLKADTSEDQMLDHVLELPGTQDDISAVYFYAGNAEGADPEGTALQTKALETCKTLKKILLKMQNDLSLVVITRFAWPSPEQNTQPPVHGSGLYSASLWGLIRTALREDGVHSRVQLVELQTEKEEAEGLDKLAAVLEIPEAAQSPELLLTDTGVYILQIAHCDGSAPLFRRHALDSSCRVSAHFQDSSCTQHHLRYDDSTPSPADCGGTRIQLHADTAAYFTSEFFGPSSSTEVPQGTSCGEVAALEFKGRRTSNAGQRAEELVCVVPHGASSHLEVPASRALPRTLLPCYRPGFAVRLLFLHWMRKEAKKWQRVLIVANEESNSYAKLLEAMLHPSTERVRVVHTEEIQTGSLQIKPNYCVVSMVRVTADLAEKLVQVKGELEGFISAETLITERAVSILMRHFPDLRMVCARPSSLYGLHLSRIKTWVKNNAATVERACASWVSREEGCRPATSCPQDVSALFTVRTVDLSGGGDSAGTVRAYDPRLFRSDAAYLVVGGLTGLGWECVKFLAEHGGGTIVIFNRRSASAERIREMKELEEAHGCKVSNMEVDVTNKQTLAKALETVKKKASTIKGVFFGAAIVQDEVLPRMTEESMEKVMAPKIVGAWNLHELTMDMQLDYFVLHSSVASVFGNPGQGSYSAGNCFLDALALHRRSLGLSGQAINWGPLSIGILEGNDSVAKNLESAGMPQLNVPEIHHWLRIALLRDDPQIIICKLDLDKFYHLRYRVKDALLKRMQPLFWNKTAKRAPDESPAARAMLDTEELASLDRPQRHQKLTAYVTGVLQHIMALEESDLKSDSVLSELGVDSVKAMTLNAAMQDDVGYQVEIMELLQGETTVQDVVEKLDQAILSGHEEEQTDQESPENAWQSY